MTSDEQAGGRAVGRNDSPRAGVGAIALALLATGWAAHAAPPQTEPAGNARSVAAAPGGSALKLHVPSPDWRDQIIYFVMTDRFNDGDPGNNDQGAGEFEAGNNSKYNGGDLRGIEQKIDYIRGLGATALWITPPVANQWWDPQHQYSGYHGYWAENFKAVDRHVGNLDDYRRLSHALHSAGMYLVQDIVVNHTGNFFSYGKNWRASDPAFGYQPNPGSLPVTRPSQAPFDMNDPRDAAQRKAGIYHWTPEVADYSDTRQEHNYQMSGLDDLNTENPQVRAALRDSYAYWIREVGVDAYRVDTAFYVPPDYFRDFLHAKDPQHPGIAEVARQTGRDNFLVFGEGFGMDAARENKYTRKIERYMTGADGRALLPGMLNFPLYGTAADVFARGKPTAELGRRIAQMMRLHRRPHLMPTFVDNHDVDRFLAGGSVAALKQNLLLIMTLPGIPTIYYGTEQGFVAQRAAMFKAGFQSGGRDRFDTDAPLYKYIQSLAKLRTSNKVLSRGTPTVLRQSEAAAGPFAYRMSLGDEHLLVAFNSSGSAVLLDNVASGLPPGTLLRGQFAIDGQASDIVVGADGVFSLKLPARAGLVWRADGTTGVPSRAAQIRIDPLSQDVQTGDFAVSGTAGKAHRVKLVVDADLDGAQTLVVDAAGRWTATADTGRMIDPAIAHSLVAIAEDATGALAAVAAPQTFRVSRRWTTLAQLADPAGDDRGPSGRYLYPTDPSWGANRQMDLRSIKISGSGGALRIDLGMHKVTASWNPQNGFDHVAFTIYIHVPGRPGGETIMPLQNGTLPEGMRWNVRLRAGGWSNALFSAEGANATAEGTVVTPGADIRVDAKRNTITFIIPAAALGNPSSLSGAKVYITTWDYDGGYRSLNTKASGHGMGGGDAGGGPLVMDDTPVITLH